MKILGSGIIDPEELLTRHDANAAYQRSSGLHLSDIYKSLMQTIEPKRFDKRDADGNPLPMDMTRIEAGSAFETILERGLAERHQGLIRPGEIDFAGVCASPDGLDLETDPMRLLEYKATWMSVGPGIDDKKFWHWWVQIKGYLHMLNQAYGCECYAARLIAFFVRGHYKYEPAPVPGFADPLPDGPLLLYFDREFSPRDLQENWQMLMNHAKSRGML